MWISRRIWWSRVVFPTPITPSTTTILPKLITPYCTVLYHAVLLKTTCFTVLFTYIFSYSLPIILWSHGTTSIFMEYTCQSYQKAAASILRLFYGLNYYMLSYFIILPHISFRTLTPNWRSSVKKTEPRDLLGQGTCGWAFTVVWLLLHLHLLLPLQNKSSHAPKCVTAFI